MHARSIRFATSECSPGGSHALERTTVFSYTATIRCNVIYQVFLSLASSHNAVYRMVDGLRPLLEDFQVRATALHSVH